MSVRHLELADFRIFRAAQPRPRARGDHGHHRVRTAPGRPACSRPWPTSAPGARSAARRPRPWCAPARTSAIVRAELDGRDSPTLVEARDPAGRAQPHPGEPQAGQRAAGARRRRAVHHLLARGPRHRQRRAEGPARPPRRRAGGARRRGSAGGRRDRAGPAPARRAAAPVGRPGREPRSPPPSTCGTSGWPTPARSSWRPASGSWPTSTRSVASAYGHLAGAGGPGARRASATSAAGTATCSTRWLPPGADDLRRGVNTVGPHRDDLVLEIDGQGGPDPRLTGRATVPGPGPAPGRARARPRPHDRWSRPCSSTTSSPSSTRPAAGPWWPSCPPGQSILTTAAPAARGDRGGPAAPGAEPGEPDDEHGGRDERARGAVGRVHAPAVGPAGRRRRRPAVMEAVFTRWEELVGARAGRARAARRVDGRVLVVAADHPAWATRARMESGQILARVQGARGDVRSTGWRSSSSAPERHVP